MIEVLIAITLIALFEMYYFPKQLEVYNNDPRNR